MQRLATLRLCFACATTSVPSSLVSVPELTHEPLHACLLLLVHLAVTPDGADFDQVVGDLRRAQFKKIPPDRFGREVMANALPL